LDEVKVEKKHKKAALISDTDSQQNTLFSFVKPGLSNTLPKHTATAPGYLFALMQYYILIPRLY
jgi:hypothetical protein